MSRFLEKLDFPNDIKTMSYEDLELLSYEIRDFLIGSVSRTGGHLSSNLGIVEISLAVHRMFDPPQDKLIWDVGHQTYVHKILTGRMNRFPTLRKFKGMSGFPKTAESEYDLFDTGHSSTSISLGLGMAAARDLKKDDYHVVSIIGDGAMTGGMAFEALNNADSRMIVLLNDNGMSISPNTGGLSRHLSKLRSSGKYLNMKARIKKNVSRLPLVGESIVAGMQHAKDSIKYAMIDGIVFEALGVKYFGPIDGHNIKELCETLELAKNAKGPVLIHAITQKGKGYTKAEDNPNVYHGVGPFDMETGQLLKKSIKPSYSGIFGNKLIELADQIVEDVCLQRLPVVFCLDRAGIVGADGETHHGIFDLGYLKHIPGMTVMAPKDGTELTQMMDMALTMDTPCAIRYPRGSAPQLGFDTELEYGRSQRLVSGSDVVDIWALGSMVEKALDAAEMLTDHGIDAGVVNMAFVKPMDTDMLIRSAGQHRLIVTLEDNLLLGGVGEEIDSILVNNDIRVVNIGWPDSFIEHGSSDELYEKYRMDAASIAERILEELEKQA